MKYGKAWVSRHFVGHVSKSALLTRLLPLSFLSFLVPVLVASYFFPSDYNWRVHVISKLTSPHNNPEAYWLASLGIMAAMLLALPFGGYVAKRLNAIMPRIARSAGFAFAFGFLLMSISMVVQLTQPLIGLRKLHTHLAQVSAGLFISGMLCCCACALKDRLRMFGGRASLPVSLASFWVCLTLLPVVLLGCLQALLLLGGQAEEFRQSFRHTPLWHLAFWEWVGAVLAFAFLGGSVMLLPISGGEKSRDADG